MVFVDFAEVGRQKKEKKKGEHYVHLILPQTI